MNDKNQLEVGDVIFTRQGYGRRLSSHKVERCTKTLAIAGRRKFTREVGSGGSIREYPRPTGWNRGSSPHIFTEELDTEHRVQVLAGRLDGYDFSKLPLDILLEITKTINDHKEGEQQ